MVQIRTTRRFRIRSTFDVRWLVVMGVGLLVSLAYYVGLIWAGVWAVRALASWVMGLLKP